MNVTQTLCNAIFYMTVYGVNFNALTFMLNVATINLNFLTSEVITFNHTASLTYLLHSNIFWYNIMTNQPPICMGLVFYVIMQKKKKKECCLPLFSSVASLGHLN